ncbi:MAG: patatin-like phospholipase family protein [Gammaproteobacteria bacterium]|jgi:NTE family protein|nr:patatin-like phospholipase family protein [Gammaproteobacteria bacterium]
MATVQKTVNLALQGGGAHGAFAWGVLDKLLEDGRLAVEGVCATSAGTMNACALAYGMHLGGPERARQALHDFWWNIHRSGQTHNPVRLLPWERWLGRGMEHSLAYVFFDSLTRTLSPYQFNPFDINPLRDVLLEAIDFDELRRCECVKLFISATHVASGKVRVFEAKDMSIDVAMASACLPFLFKAVTVNGEDFWDGGYVGNPALFPLYYDTESRDVIIVHINPVARQETPRQAPDIMNRLNEISFNSSLLKEMRAIAFVKKLVEHDMLKDEYKAHFKDVLVHSVRADKALCEFSVASKFSSDWEFLTKLRDRGREQMADWLDEHFDAIGQRDTVDLHNEFLTSTSRLFEDRPRDEI